MFNSCEREDVEAPESSEELTLEGDLTGMSIGLKDLNVIGEAMKRMDVAVVDGKIVTNGRSAKQLRISEDLFENLQWMFARSNGEIRNGRLRKKVEGEFSNVDCVPNLLSYVLKCFGKDVSSESIKSWCRSKGYYVEGQGTKANCLDTIIREYLEASWISSSGIPNEYRDSQGGTFLISVKNGDGSGHFVKVLGVYGESPNRKYLCNNPQDGTNGIYTESDILNVYSVSGAKQLMYVDAKKMIAEEVAGYNGVTEGAKQKELDMGKWVTELSATASKMVANADKACLVDFPDIVPSDKCDWKHCQQLVFEKKDCPTYYVTVLYTDKGYEQAQKYLPAAFGVFRYGKQAGAPEFIK